MTETVGFILCLCLFGVMLALLGALLYLSKELWKDECKFGSVIIDILALIVFAIIVCMLMVGFERGFY